MNKEIKARILTLHETIEHLKAEEMQVVEIANKKVLELDRAKKELIELASTRQMEINQGVISRQGAIFELLKLLTEDEKKELEELLKPKMEEAPLQEEAQAEAEAE